GGLGQTDIGNKVAITGKAREFYRRIGAHDGNEDQWVFEPLVADSNFRTIIATSSIRHYPGYWISKLKKSGRRITEVIFRQQDNGKLLLIRAKMFIDCSYEGDLMAAAGVSYVVGRESSMTYGESLNGVQMRDKHQFPDAVDPWIIPGDASSGLLWGISNEQLNVQGSGDRHVQAYNFRLCLTDDTANRIPITRPQRYDSTRYELLIRQLAVYTPDSLNWELMHFAIMPNHKTDINNCGGFSTDMIGSSDAYPEADWPERLTIIRDHKDYTLGLLYFISNDNRIPKHLRNEMSRWGLPKDEFRNNGNFTPQLYVREARRLKGPYVMTQRNCLGADRVKDGVGLAAYTMDSHNCQRVVVNGMVKNEGDVQVGGFPPYPVSYRSITPLASECENLLVPVCLSASHIAYGSIRMEPVFMVLGQSAATAAVMALDQKISVQDVDVQSLRRSLGFID
ncbi:MAG: FAD-dependent oxidoreductase, partial [Bacteroidota bacterium]